MNLVLSILEAVESSEVPIDTGSLASKVSTDKASRTCAEHHIALLDHQGFFIHSQKVNVSLSWAGHDFLDLHRQTKHAKKDKQL